MKEVSRLRMFTWFLGRPQHYPELARRIMRRLTRHGSADLRDEAQRWCAERAVTTKEAIHFLTGIRDVAPVSDIAPDVWSSARAAEADCPVKMGGPGALDLLYHLCQHGEARRVIETGVAYGWSSLAILSSLANRPGSQLCSTDLPYPGLKSDAWVGCVVPTNLRRGWKLLRKSDRDALPEALEQLPELDLVHYDSDKSYDGRSWAYPLLWNALREGGYLVSDDVGDNLAFRDFCWSVGREPVIARVQASQGSWRQYVGVITK